MREAGLTPNVISYNAALDSLAKCGQWEKALDLMKEMSGDAVQPTITTYGIVSGACFRGGEQEKGLDLMKEMQMHGIRPTLSSTIQLSILAERLAIGSKLWSSWGKCAVTVCALMSSV